MLRTELALLERPLKVTVLCQRCLIQRRNPHRPCYAVGCNCPCSHRKQV